MVSEGNKLSTTALAKKLDIPTQQLFATLKDYGWIERANESWILTQKGEFEGGSYHNSRRFGAYWHGNGLDDLYSREVIANNGSKLRHESPNAIEDSRGRCFNPISES